MTAVKVGEPSHGTVTLNADGSFTYTPVADYEGSDSFTYKANDGQDSNVVTVTITVGGSNDIPSITEIEDQTIDEDGETGSLSFTIADADQSPEELTVTALTNNPILVPLDHILLSGHDGERTVKVIPASNQYGTAVISIVVSDGIQQVTESFTVEVNSINDIPSITDGDIVGNEDENVQFAKHHFDDLFNDVDGDHLQKIIIESVPTRGTLRLSSITVSVYQEIEAADLPNLVYTPEDNWSGETAFAWRGFDGQVYSDPRTFTIHINAVNDEIAVSDFTKTGAEDHNVAFASDDFATHYSDSDGDPLLEVMFATLPAHGRLTLHGGEISVAQSVYIDDLNQIVYLPDLNWYGEDSFAWKGYDGTAYSADTALVTLLISPENDSPFVNQPVGNQSMQEGSSRTLDLSAVFRDVDDSSLTVQGVSSDEGIVSIESITSDAIVVRAVSPGRATIELSARDSQNAVATTTLEIEVRSVPPTGNPSEPTAPTLPEETNTGVDVLVNGKVENAGTAITSKINNQTVTTVVVDEKKLQDKLAAEGNGTVITIPLNMNTDVVIGELNGRTVHNMEQKQAVVVIRTENANYTLPARQINMSSVSEQIGKDVALQDIKIRIEIATPTEEVAKIVASSAAKGGFEVVVPSLNFSVRAIYNDQSVELSKFTAYVERNIAIPDGVDPNKITTGVVVEPDGTVSHVPTKVVLENGKYYAQINSLTNSTYSVVWHPIEFKDVAKHWAKEAVNDLGSRMVIEGIGQDLFDPDQDITRAEFAAIMVRGLGLKLEGGDTPFSDVNAKDWYHGSVRTAYSYGLISGFEDGTFRPLQKITREEAMTILARAMKLTNPKFDSSKSADELLSPFADIQDVSGWARSSIVDSLRAGIVSGRSNNKLAPKANITRAEVAALVQKLLRRSELI